jgi:hypothetical protein
LRAFAQADRTPAPVPFIDIETFARNCAIEHPRHGPVMFVPYDYQSAALTTIAQEKHFFTIATARQMGATTLLAIYALYEAASKPNQTIVVSSGNLASALEIISRIRYAIEYGHHTETTLREAQCNKASIMLSNGSHITARAVSTSTLRGMKFDLLIVDNAAFISYKTLTEFLQSAQMLQEQRGGKIVLCSTPKLAEGPFFEAYRNSRGRLKLTWDMHPDRNIVWANAALSNLGARSFSQEHDAQFIEDIKTY